MARLRHDAVVIGAGPYGLAVAAHLRAAGVETHVFGEAMSYWAQRMPAGMVLRSERAGSNIADPRRELTLDRFEQVQQTALPRRIPLNDFVAYGRWYQQQAVPDLDGRRVTRVDAVDHGYQLTLDDGEQMAARKVVVASGLDTFARRPPAFQDVSPDLAPHTSSVPTPAVFAGKRVAVIGGGQSAIEYTALLHEAGAEVEVIARAPRIYWLNGRLRRYCGPTRKLLYPPGEVGPLGINWLVELPNLFRRLPEPTQKRVAERAIRPAGGGWLRSRVDGVPITTGCSVVNASAAGDGVRLILDDGSTRLLDHAILATGYQPDVTRFPFLPAELSQHIRQRGGYPLLNAGFESSLPGLYFVGAAAAESFGPLMRFVAGSGYTARTLSRWLAKANAPVAQLAPVGSGAAT